MDGYTLTEKMRKARRSFRLTATEQALFYELVAICNGEGWRDIFDCSNVELCYALNINEKTLVRARESLINAGLIYYKSGKSKRLVSTYSFIKQLQTTVKNTVDVTTNVTANVTTNVTTNAPDYNKLKTKTRIISPPACEEKFSGFPPPEVFEESLAKCYETLRTNQSWAETVTMNIRASGYIDFTLQSFSEHLKLFFMKLQNEGEQMKSPKDAMSHFSRWLECKLENKKNERKTDKSRNRGGAMPIPDSPKYSDSRKETDSDAASLTGWIDSLPIGY